MKKVLLLLIFILLIFGFWAYQYQAAEGINEIKITDKQKGVCWVGSPRPLEGWEMDSLRHLGISHISQTPFGWQSDPNDPSIRWERDSEKMWWGESLEGVKITTELGREKGVESILKPHLWVQGHWPGAISMQSEEDWANWFAQYTEFILYYASFAQAHQIPILCIGTELEGTTKREEDWRLLIAKIRVAYTGELTYAANFTEYEHIEFWDALDYIGIQAYFPLSEKSNPNLKTLVKGWNNKIKEIEKVQRVFQKPVLFTEIGYCNTIDASVEPWVWPNERREVALSEEMQALCYQAFFETAWQKNWLAGAYFWKWYPQPRDRDPDFTPQNKLAQGVLQDHFLKQ